MFSSFIYYCQHCERKTICLDICLLSDRQWDTEHQNLLRCFLGVSILQLLIIYRIHDYDNWRCHSNSVNTGSRLPNISDVKTRKRRNMIGIDMIRNNRWNSNRWWPDENIALPYQAYPSFPVELKTSGHRPLTTPLFTYVMQSLYTYSRRDKSLKIPNM